MKIDIVLTASGESRRFGSENKLLHKINGRAVFDYALENALELKAKLSDIINGITVVSRYAEIEKICSYKNVKYIHNAESHKGISASIHLGVENTPKDNAIMFMVCDQPFMKVETLVKLVTGFVNSGKSLACLMSEEGKTSNPCIFDRAWRGELLAIEGDRGGKSIIKKNVQEVFFCKGASDIEFVDIDTPPIFDFIDEKGCIISLVGGGGKTTLMYTLAEMCNQRGMRVLITTTTHIFKPEKYSLAVNKEELLQILNSGKIAVMGEETENNKLKMIDDIEDYFQFADIVIIEADGAKRLPLKVPNDTEPVILPCSDIVIGVAGVDAVGKPLKDVCFRKEKACELLGVNEEHIITEEDIANILSSENGAMKNANGRKYFAVVNKCDTDCEKAIGRNIKNMLSNKGVKAFVCALKEGYFER
jgi:probable selenium-dependent hydroxylase accessory protein YqeC